MEDAKYCGRDWIPTGNWPQAQYKPSNDRTTPGDFAQVLRCGSSHLNFGTFISSNFLHSFTVTPWYLPRVLEGIGMIRTHHFYKYFMHVFVSYAM